MDEQTFEQVETTTSIDDFYADTEDAKTAIDGRILGAGAAIVAIGGGLLAKKFGPAIKAKTADFRRKHLEKSRAKLAAKQLKLDAELEKLTPKEEAKTE